MNVFTIGFTKKSAEEFFALIKSNEIKLMLDVRLKNVSQLAGFSKGDDLRYFLHSLCNCEYSHALEFAPTKELLDGYKHGTISWNDYEVQYRALIEVRNSLAEFQVKYVGDRICLLCSEPTAEQCHRRLLAEMLAARLDNVTVTHI